MATAIENLQIVSLLDANQDELDCFSSQVARCKGKLQVLTHPFYQNQDNIYPEITGYAEMRDKYIKACLTHSIPLAIFEEPDKCHLLPERVNHNPGILYVVKTDGATSDLENIEADPRILVWKLKMAKVSHIVAGGQYMFLEKYPNNIADLKETRLRKKLLNLDSLRSSCPKANVWIKQRLLPGKCAGGIAYNLLLAGFDVTLSPISSPHNFYLGHHHLVQDLPFQIWSKKT